MAKYKARVYLGSKSGYSNIEVDASTANEARNQLKNIYNVEQILSLNVQSDYSKSNVLIIPFIVIATIIFNYTAITFSIIFGLITLKIVKIQSGISILLILITMFVGFQIGNFLHYKYFSSPVQQVSHSRLHTEDHHANLNIVKEVPNVHN